MAMAGISASSAGSCAARTQQKKLATLEIAPEKYIGGNRPCFIIAEIGQNHQGDIQLAKKLVQTAFDCGADCVKFQKSDLRSRFTKDVLRRPYECKQSFGKTYGEHRMHLELTEENFAELKLFSDELKIYFTASGMDIPSMDFLNSLGVHFFKIGSADATNLPLLRHVAKYQKPMIISTGMTKKKDVRRIYDEIYDQNKSIVLLQCTSCYPTEPCDVNLNVIKSYTEMFPKAVIGYSGHEMGIEISIAAVASGAKVLERHLTLDHSLKGSDHIASLNPEEFAHLVKSIRKIEEAMGSYEKDFEECEKPCYDKLGKTVVATRFLKRGTLLREDMMTIKVSSNKGFTTINYDNLIGRELTRDVEEDDLIPPNYVDFWSWPGRRNPSSPMRTCSGEILPF